MLAKLLVAVVAALALFAAPAHASVAYEHDRAVWIAGDDGSGATRLAAGYAPSIAPGGGTVLYRDRRGIGDLSLAPDGRRVAAIRLRGDRCDIAVLASGRTRSLRRVRCPSVISWDGPRIGLLSAGTPPTRSRPGSSGLTVAA